MILDMIRRRATKTSSVNLRDPVLNGWFGSNEVASGVNVTEQTALNTSAVFRAVYIIASALASVPFPVYKRLPNDERERDPNHPVYNLLNRQANPDTPAYHLIETLTASALTWGNGYAEIIRETNGTPKALWILQPERVTPRAESGVLKYAVRNKQGEVVALVPAKHMLHLRGIGKDGITGYSVVALARESIGLGMAAENFGAQLFGNGTQPGGVLEIPGKLETPEAVARLKQSWGEAHGGENKLSVAVLEAGAKWQATSIPPEDAQFLETRKFQIIEIARWFGVQPSKLFDLTDAHYANIEQSAIDFVTDTLIPWARRWEVEIASKLIAEPTHYAELLFDGMLRGDHATRSQAYATELSNGVRSINEVRKLENLPGIGSDGDAHLVPMNLAPIGLLVDPPPAPPPAPIPVDDDDEEDQDDQRSIELRAAKGKSLIRRRQAQVASRRVFTDSMSRVVTKETKAVKRKVESYAKTGDWAGLRAWLGTFYADFGATVQRAADTPVRHLGDTIWSIVSESLEGPSEAPADLRAFLDEYLDTFALRYVGASEGRLASIIERTEPGSMETTLTNQVDDWAEKKAEQVGRNESVRAASAIAVTAWVALGVSKKIWRASGAETCPICQPLDGRTVGVTKSFVRKGAKLDNGKGSPMTVKHDYLHPPLHDGCDCSIEDV